jgi:hypothetical protein
MSPFRIRRPPRQRTPPAPEWDDGVNDFRYYLDRLIRMIPSQVVGLYQVGYGVIPTERVAQGDRPIGVGNALCFQERRTARYMILLAALVSGLLSLSNLHAQFRVDIKIGSQPSGPVEKPSMGESNRHEPTRASEALRQAHADYEAAKREYSQALERQRQVEQTHREALERQRQVEQTHREALERQRQVAERYQAVLREHERVMNEFEAQRSRYDAAYHQQRGRDLLAQQRTRGRQPSSDRRSSPRAPDRDRGARNERAAALARGSGAIIGTFSPASEQALIDIRSVAEAADAAKRIMAIAAFAQVFSSPKLRPSTGIIPKDVAGELAPVAFRIQQSDWGLLARGMTAVNTLARTTQATIAFRRAEELKDDPSATAEEIAFWIHMSRSLTP